ncbi:RNA-binding S4 domain-containing protein [bacterium]|nr:RNA-binding S4 domain-containing protein [bacterium]
MACQTRLKTNRIRLDKWLKLSRIYKTRALATRACEDGKVKVNGQRAKPARAIQIGDQLTIKFRKAYRTFDVLGIVHKNVSKKDARDLYFERMPQLSEKEKELYALLQEWNNAGKRKYKGRPTKKERRNMDKFRER